MWEHFLSCILPWFYVRTSGFFAKQTRKTHIWERTCDLFVLGTGYHEIQAMLTLWSQGWLWTPSSASASQMLGYWCVLTLHQACCFVGSTGHQRLYVLETLMWTVCTGNLQVSETLTPEQVWVWRRVRRNKCLGLTVGKESSRRFWACVYPVLLSGPRSSSSRALALPCAQETS